MPATIVYVHGNGNQVRAELLKALWDQAVFGREMGERSRMAYWASLRYDEPLPDSRAWGEPELSDEPELESAAPAAEPTESFIARVRSEAGEGLEIEPAGDRLAGWLERMSYTADALAEGEAATAPDAPQAEVLPLPRDARVAIFRALVRVAFKDVHAYFFGGCMEPMRKVVRDALPGPDGPVIVLGHSLGSIIAYDVLRESAGGGRQIPLFLTVGSPLAVTEVQDLITAPLEVPAGVAAWRNVADCRDLVASDPTVRPEYAPPEMCADFAVRNDSFTHHAIRRYLPTAPVRGPMKEWFGP